MLLSSLEAYGEHYNDCIFKIKKQEKEKDSKWLTVQAEGTRNGDYFFRELKYNPSTPEKVTLGDSFRVEGKEYEVDTTSPSLGLINTPTDVRYVMRKPLRQWRKAFKINAQSYKSLPCSADISRQYRVRARSSPLFTSNTTLLAYFIFNQEYYDIDQALDMLEKGECLSIALNSKYAISFNIYNLEHYTLYYKNNLVGLLNKESNEVQLLESYEHLTSDIRFTILPDRPITTLQMLPLEEVNNET
mgnify:FL=1